MYVTWAVNLLYRLCFEKYLRSLVFTPSDTYALCPTDMALLYLINSILYYPVEIISHIIYIVSDILVMMP